MRSMDLHSATGRRGGLTPAPRCPLGIGGGIAAGLGLVVWCRSCRGCGFGCLRETAPDSALGAGRQDQPTRGCGDGFGFVLADVLEVAGDVPSESTTGTGSGQPTTTGTADETEQSTSV